MEILSISTVVVVQDMDTALGFYHRTLGLTLVEEAEDWAQFQEGVGLMLSPEPLPEGVRSPNTVSLALNVADTHAAYHWLTEQGVPFLVGPTEVEGAVVATLRDPDGNLVQLIQRT